MSRKLGDYQHYIKNMTKQTIIALTVTTVLFAITSNVSEAAKINPNRVDKPNPSGTVFGKDKADDCLFKHSTCVTADYTEKDLEGCRWGRAGRSCRQINKKARCHLKFKKCKKSRKKR